MCDCRFKVRVRKILGKNGVVCKKETDRQQCNTPCPPPAPLRYVGKCASWGDTHLITFDDKKYDWQGTGVYTFFNDPHSDEEMQVLQKSCSRGRRRVSCNRGFAWRSGKDYLVIRTKNTGHSLLETDSEMSKRRRKPTRRRRRRTTTKKRGSRRRRRRSQRRGGQKGPGRRYTGGGRGTVDFYFNGKRVQSISGTHGPFVVTDGKIESKRSKGTLYYNQGARAGHYYYQMYSTVTAGRRIGGLCGTPDGNANNEFTDLVSTVIIHSFQDSVVASL